MHGRCTWQIKMTILTYGCCLWFPQTWAVAATELWPVSPRSSSLNANVKLNPGFSLNKHNWIYPWWGKNMIKAKKPGKGNQQQLCNLCIIHIFRLQLNRPVSHTGKFCKDHLSVDLYFFTGVPSPWCLYFGLENLFLTSIADSRRT